MADGVARFGLVRRVRAVTAGRPSRAAEPVDGIVVNLRVGRIGRLLAPGFGACLRCMTPWRFVREHITRYTPSSGCFPLCEKCWAEMTPEQRRTYYVELIAMWEMTEPVEGAKRAAVLAAVAEGR